MIRTQISKFIKATISQNKAFSKKTIHSQNQKILFSKMKIEISTTQIRFQMTQNS